MTIRNLEYMFRPKSIALIWGDQDYVAYGEPILKNLSEGGFKGNIFSIHPEKKTIPGISAFKSLDDISQAPDLAVIARPRKEVPNLIKQLGEKGTKAAILISYGFGEGGDNEGLQYREQTLKAAKPYLLRIVGAGSLGVIVPGQGFNAGYAHVHPKNGNVAFVAQSGTLLSSVLDWATYRNIGFSHLVSLGDMVDVDFGDMLNYLSMDGHNRAILMYVEQVTNARKFMSAARAAARMKPVIVVKSGRHPEGAKAAESHTGAMAGSDAVYDAVFRRAGILRVNDIAALFDAVQTLSTASRAGGDRLAILTNGGAMGVIATDTLIEKKGRLGILSDDTLAKLDEVLPHPWSHGNPVDIGGDANGKRYAQALEILLEDKGINAIMVLNCPSAIASSTESAQEIIQTVKKNIYGSISRQVLTSWLGDGASQEARKAFAENKIPTYNTPTEAVRGFMQLIRYKNSQEMLMQIPPTIPEDFTPDTDKARSIIEKALKEGHTWLNEAESKEVLTAYGIPVVETLTAKTPGEAGMLAEKIGCPVVLKILSPDIHHKTRFSGVVLDLETPAMVEKTAIKMLERIQEAKPGAHIYGFTVQPMIYRKNARELIMGMVLDHQFGPVIIFGYGGSYAEIIKDSAMGLPPLNMHLAKEVISQTAICRVLEAYQGVPGADIEAIALTLVKVSQLICDVSQVAELEINPIIADEHGVLALDARIKVMDSDISADKRLAIRPYPKKLEETITLADGTLLLLRPIRPEDGPALQELHSRLSPEEIRFRFLHPMKNLSPHLSARLTQIDYDREMALVLTWKSGSPEILGVVRITADPNIENSEFAIVIRRDMTGQGLGPMLLRRIIDYSKSRGIKYIYGEVLSDNLSMLKLAEAFGFKKRPVQDDPGVMHVSLRF
jgi:acetyltransferase